MKTILLCLLLLCAIALPLYAQSEVDDTLKEDVRALKEDVLVIKTDLENLKENVAKGFETVDKNFDRIEKNFDRQNNIIIACIGLPLAILAIGATVWGILTHRRGVRDSAQREEIEMLKAEIETLKQRHIVNP
ncbi:hypothetical protein F4009_15905 [Candidatus Poribacteria bacterium]|nr:hypothetical protein [Candidatus Poribacteria bacterium]MYH81774.1 hypothetical protein [Candidatus Poribacteria bacterium]MYK95458.1 hypothetical protein [Candidatus Poribacteria bacterium]